MKIVPILASLLATVLPSLAGDSYMLIANAGGTSEQIILAQGDTAELKFCSFNPEGIGASISKVIVNASGREFNMTTSVLESGATYKMNPVKVAGPAIIKYQITGGNTAHFATFDVNRIGTASTAVPIPLEAGTTWQVLLEASSDLTNWAAVAPGDYFSSTPQRYFRTRIIKRS